MNNRLTTASIYELLVSCSALHKLSDTDIQQLIPTQSATEKHQQLQTLRLLLHSGAYLHQQLYPILPVPSAGHSATNDSDCEIDLLSMREREVLTLLGRGYTLPQIGKKLFISPTTVNNHCARMREKLGLRGRNALISYAIAISKDV